MQVSFGDEKDDDTDRNNGRQIFVSDILAAGGAAAATWRFLTTKSIVSGDECRRPGDK